MKITVTSKIPKSSDTVIFNCEDGDLPAGIPPAEFQGKAFSHCLVRHDGQRILHVGLGKSQDVTPHHFRKASALAARKLNGIGAERIAFDLGKFADEAEAIVDGALTGVYRFDDFLPESRKHETELKGLTLVASKAKVAEIRKLARTGQIFGEAVNHVRQVGNQPANVIYPESLAAEAKKLAKDNGLTCKVRSEAALKREKFGGLLAVGGGSARPPQLIELGYDCGKAKAPTIAVVGKAITFDTGGISLKPGADMDEMKFDKMGGCAVLGIMQAVAQLKLPIHVTGLIAAAENMPGSRAYRPGDIVTTYDGQTIEVLNTDAEGRVVLADALGYARLKLKPDYMIDLATLTGAVIVALGKDRSGLFTTQESRHDDFVRIGERTGDRVWPLPVGDEFDEAVKSEIATVKNSAGRWGGSCTAASFLKTWTGDIPWTHLDIAGTGWHSSAQPWAEKGATGAGVRLVTEFIREFSA